MREVHKLELKIIVRDENMRLACKTVNAITIANTQMNCISW